MSDERAAEAVCGWCVGRAVLCPTGITRAGYLGFEGFEGGAGVHRSRLVSRSGNLIIPHSCFLLVSSKLPSQSVYRRICDGWDAPIFPCFLLNWWRGWVMMHHQMMKLQYGSCHSNFAGLYLLNGCCWFRASPHTMIYYHLSIFVAELTGCSCFFFDFHTTFLYLSTYLRFSWFLLVGLTRYLRYLSIDIADCLLYYYH